MLKEINDVAKSFQQDHHSLAACRDDLDSFTEAVHDEKSNRNSPFSNCRLGTTYIGQDSKIVDDYHF